MRIGQEVQALSRASALIHVAAGVLTRSDDGRVLVARRPEGRHLAGRWEFPGGKIEPGEKALEGLGRELREEIGVDAIDARPLIRYPWTYPDRRVRLDVWAVKGWRGTPRGREGQAVAWKRIDELRGLALAAGSVPALAALELPPLYLITPEPDSPARFLDRLAECLDGGVRLVQLRAKHADREAVAALTSAAVKLVERAGGRLFLNADPAAARAAGAHGAHLTSRALADLGERPAWPGFGLAASCHDAAELARARALEVDFAVLSPVRATPGHPWARPIGWDGFSSLVETVDFPVFALGGLGPGDLDAAWAAGAQGVAAIRGLWNRRQAGFERI